MYKAQFLTLALAAACELKPVEEAGFPLEFAEVQCVIYKKCYRMYFDGEFEVMEKCVERVHDQYAEEVPAECSYNGNEAQECLDLLNSATCEEYWEEYWMTSEQNGQIYAACHDEPWDC
jgi:hypothetical protein